MVPARPYKPRDKAKVESGVQVVQRWIVAALRNRSAMKFKYMKMTTDGTTVKRYDGYETAGVVKEFEALNRLGEQGWELISVLLKGSDHIFYFRLKT